MDNILQVVTRHFRPAPPEPRFTVKALFERSILFECIKEKEAKLETFRAQEVEFRALLVATYASMAYEAERAKFKTETRAWAEGETLQVECDRIESALDAHNNCIEMIASFERSIADDQSDLDDAELWEQVVVNGGAA